MSDVDAMVAWLREQWDADEKAARAATPGPWAASGHSLITAEDMVEDIEFADIPRRDAAHVARHDPADTLARIEAERAILEQYEQARKAASDHWLQHRGSSGDTSSLLLTMMHEHDAIVSTLEHALRALASGYRHRAGWQEGWVQP
ncbi:DUF6221 family protein [Streptomonospora wellingtoniae]|uniref:DUF6221 family protein n=1 Tax=Streptomonospora wellingtoniae TaxID=3075544 RepID=A0ABU2KU96_9ACTN|nr:DUF6221 family protein [Streptomonospora sp. DSM 45055]MDT0302875.1 DUF6221 family protein [Streptomonospora sp. DSM 45055]